MLYEENMITIIINGNKSEVTKEVFMEYKQNSKYLLKEQLDGSFIVLEKMFG
jgi:hypothetical protein